MDCVLRYGKLPDSDLVARQVAMMERLTCATPGYLERYGMPTDLESLNGHVMVGIRQISTGNVTPLEFVQGDDIKSVSLPCPLAVTGTESYLAGIELGLGLAQVPRFHIAEQLKCGSLVQILRDTPPPSAPVSLLYPRSRQLSPRVRAFLDWAAGEFAANRLLLP